MSSKTGSKDHFSKKEARSYTTGQQNWTEETDSDGTDSPSVTPDTSLMSSSSSRECIPTNEEMMKWKYPTHPSFIVNLNSPLKTFNTTGHGPSGEDIEAQANIEVKPHHQHQTLHQPQVQAQQPQSQPQGASNSIPSQDKSKEQESRQGSNSQRFGALGTSLYDKNRRQIAGIDSRKFVKLILGLLIGLIILIMLVLFAVNTSYLVKVLDGQESIQQELKKLRSICGPAVS